MPTGLNLDLSGKKYGCLTVLSKSHFKRCNRSTTVYWNCRCECGGNAIRTAQNIVHRNPTRCGYKCNFFIDKKQKELIGKKFFKRTILSVSNNEGTTKVLVKCDCGSISKIDFFRLKGGHSNQCKNCAFLSSSIKQKGKPAHNRLNHGVAASNSIFSSYKAGAKTRGISFELTKEDFLDITQLDCYYCGAKPSTIRRKSGGVKTFYGAFTYNGVDRLNNEPIYSKDNCVACCSDCNYMKQDHSLSSFMDKVKSIYLKHFTKEK